MGLLDGILGGALGAGALQIAGKLINDHGGIEGIAQEFQKQGLGGMVQSWIGGGANQAITPDQVHQVLGEQKINEMAQQAGVTPAEVSQHLANGLPTVIDKLTPSGEVPAGNPMAGGLEAITKLFN
jgi:uncharacterized protein YidB (DUF937 family)